MELSIYQVIKGPIVSPKAQMINRQQNKLVLAVHPQANKPMIRQAMKQLFNVDVASVNILVRKGKNRRRPGSRLVITSGVQKRAVVTLKPGQNIAMFGGSEQMPEQQS